MGGCESTFFKLQNKTVKKLTTKVIWLEDDHFSLPNRPDRNLDEHTLPPDSFFREQINVYYSEKGNWFHLELTFDDANTTKLVLEVDQSLAARRDASFHFSGDISYYDVTNSVNENELCVTITDSTFGLQEIEELKKKSKEMLTAIEIEKVYAETVAEDNRRKHAAEFAGNEQRMIKEEALAMNEVGLNLLDTAALCTCEMKENAVRLCVEAVELFDKAAAISANDDVRKLFLQAIRMLRDLFAYSQAERAEDIFEKHFPNNVRLLRKAIPNPQYDGNREHDSGKHNEKTDFLLLSSKDS